MSEKFSMREVRVLGDLRDSICSYEVLGIFLEVKLDLASLFFYSQIINSCNCYCCFRALNIFVRTRFEFKE